MSLRRPAATLALLVALAPTGCYLAHERDVARDAGTVDAATPPDAGLRCRAGDIEVDIDVYSTRTHRASGGTVVLENATGELARDRRAERLTTCAPAHAAPVTATFALAHGGTVIIGVDDDLRGEIITGDVSRALPSHGIEGTLVHSVEGSTFRLHIDAHRVVDLTTSPFATLCEGVLSDCHLRFIELAPDGALLGGGALWRRRRSPEPLVLEATERTIRTMALDVALPETGLLAGVPLRAVLPLACEGVERYGATAPGNIDLWRCAYSGTSTIEPTAPGVARASVSYLDGGIRTNFVAAVLADGDGLEAVSIEPCCDAPIRFRFGEVRRLEVHGETVHSLQFTVDAPGYDYPFGYQWEPGPSFALYGFRPGRPLRAAGYTAVSLISSTPIDIPEDLSVGAITTEGGPPWSRANRVSWVRRVLRAGPNTWTLP